MISVPNFFPQFLSLILSLAVIGDRIGTELGIKNANDSDTGSSMKLPYMHGFHAINNVFLALQHAQEADCISKV